MKKLGLLFVVVISLVSTASCISKEVQVTETYYETEYKNEPYVEIGKEHQEYITPKWERYAPLYFTKLEWTEAGVESHIDGYEISTADIIKGQVKLVLSNNPQASLWEIVVINLTGIGPLSEPPPQSGLAVQKVIQGKVKYIPGAAEQQWLDDLNTILADQKHCLFTARSDQYIYPDITFNVTGVEEFAVITCTPPHWLVSSGPVIEKAQLIWSGGITQERQVPYQVEKQRTVIQTKKVPFWETWKTNPSAETESSSLTNETSPPMPSAKLIYSDDFSNPNSGWLQASSDEGESYYKDGEFHGIVNKRDWASWWYNRNAGRFGDFIMEEDIKLISGPKNSGYGLIFRCQDDNNFYRFLVSADRSYLIGTMLDSKWTELRRWTTSEFIQKDYGSNHLKVICKGSQIEVYANGYHLTTVLDNSFADGYMGGIIDTSEPGAHVAFDNLKIYSVD